MRKAYQPNTLIEPLICNEIIIGYGYNKHAQLNWLEF